MLVAIKIKWAIPGIKFSMGYLSIIGKQGKRNVGFAGSGLIFETENRFISRQEAENRSIKFCISQAFAVHRLTLSPVRIGHT